MFLQKKIALFLAFACLAVSVDISAVSDTHIADKRTFYEKYKTPIHVTIAGILFCISIKAVFAHINNKKAEQAHSQDGPQKNSVTSSQNAYQQQKNSVRPVNRPTPPISTSSSTRFIPNSTVPPTRTTPVTPAPAPARAMPQIRTTFDEFVRNYNLPVLHRDNQRHIYQIRSDMNLNGWTCGFFTLKNAKDLECLMGISRPCDIYGECTNYNRTHNINPHGGISNKQLIRLADNAVHLRNFNALVLDTAHRVALTYNWPDTYSYQIFYPRNMRAITPRVSLDRNNITVSVQAPMHTNQHQIKSAVDMAIDRELHQQFLNLRRVFDNQQRAILNFGCMLNPQEEHVFLVSVVQVDYNRRALFIYDNLNRLYTNSAGRSTFVNALYDTFCV